MQNKRAGLGVAAAGLIVAVVLFIVLSGNDSSDDADSGGTNAATETSQSGGGGGADKSASIPTIEIKGGEPVGGVQDLSFDKGGTIEFKVKSDADYEIHFHGYDVAKDVKAGGSVTFDLPATSDGIYEAEIEDTGTQIAEITVNP